MNSENKQTKSRILKIIIFCSLKQDVSYFFYKWNYYALKAILLSPFLSDVATH